MSKRSGLTVLALLLVVSVASADTTSWGLDDSFVYDFDATEVSLANSAATLYSGEFGTGLDGDLVVSSTTFDLSVDFSGFRTEPDGLAWAIPSVLSAGDGSVLIPGYGGGLAAGDELLLLVAQGTAADNAAVGTWETVRVLSAPLASPP